MKDDKRMWQAVRVRKDKYNFMKEIDDFRKNWINKTLITPKARLELYSNSIKATIKGQT